MELDLDVDVPTIQSYTMIPLKSKTKQGFHTAWHWCNSNLEKSDWTETGVENHYFFFFKYSSDAARFKFEGY
jgi:hypothetical protein